MPKTRSRAASALASWPASMRSTARATVVPRIPMPFATVRT